MTSRLKAVLATVVMLGCASSARASIFTLDSFQVSLNSTDPGLVLWETDLVNSVTFNLNNVGDSAVTQLFRLGTKETTVNLDDLVPKPIDVSLMFSSPASFSGVAQGITGAAWFSGGLGYVSWDNPLLVSFGNTGILAISLTNAIFGVPGTTDIGARFELRRQDSPLTGTTPVPEPASLLLLGSGLAAAFGKRYSRRKAA